MTVQPEIFALQRDDINDNWIWISRFLSMIENRDWEPNDVRVALLKKEAQLWGLIQDDEIKGIWITKIEGTNGDKHGLIWIAAGTELELGIKLMTEHTEPWFKEKGCHSVKVIGRRGWEKALPDYLFGGVILEKAL